MTSNKWENRNLCVELTFLETEGFLLRPQLVVGHGGCADTSVFSSVTVILALFFFFFLVTVKETNPHHLKFTIVTILKYVAQSC